MVLVDSLKVVEYFFSKLFLDVGCLLQLDCFSRWWSCSSSYVCESNLFGKNTLFYVPHRAHHTRYTFPNKLQSFCIIYIFQFFLFAVFSFCIIKTFHKEMNRPFHHYFYLLIFYNQLIILQSFMELYTLVPHLGFDYVSLLVLKVLESRPKINNLVNFSCFLSSVYQIDFLRSF